MACRSIHDFTVKDVRGNHVELSKYKGKALLMVNATSESDLTHPNYTELEKLHGKYKHHGLEILPFPFNQVGVHGPNAAPLQKYLKSSKGGQEGTDADEWDFDRVLIDKDGNIVEHYISKPIPFYSEKFKGAATTYHANQVKKYMEATKHHANQVSFEASPITTHMEYEVGKDLEKALGTDKDGNVVEGHIPTAGPPTDAAFKKFKGAATTYDNQVKKYMEATKHHANQVSFEASPVTTAIEYEVGKDLEKALGTDKDGNVVEGHIPTAGPPTDAAFKKSMGAAMHQANIAFEASTITDAIENDIKKHFGWNVVV